MVKTKKQLLYMRAYYRKHKARYKFLAQKRAETRRLLVAAFKDVPCMDCDHEFPACAMDFDHVRGRKLFDIGHCHDRCIPLYRLKKEIAKCDVVCANCHRIRTHNKRK